MKPTQLTRAVDEVVRLKLEVIDEFIEEIVDAIADLGNPEKLINKPYEEWTQLDLDYLKAIYGEESNEVTKLIIKKEHKKLLELEEQV